MSKRDIILKLNCEILYNLPFQKQMSFKKLKKQTSIYREKIGMAIIVLEQAISNIIKSIETSSKVCRGRLAPQ